MLQRHVNQLDDAGVIGSHDDCLVYQARQSPATLSQERDTGDPPLSGRPGRGNQIGALPAGAVQDQEVARTADRLYLSRKDLLEPEIISRRGQDGGVGGERYGRQGAASFDVAHHVLRRQVLCIGRAAAVATEVQGSTVSKNC